MPAAAVREMRFLVTRADAFMGPALCATLREDGATVVASEAALDEPDAPPALVREVPLGRLVSAREDATFAAYLLSRAADCLVGQVFPLCGGRVQR